MAVYYLDTSALVKLYAQEQGTLWINALLSASPRHVIYTVRLTGPELIAALSRKVRTGEITAADAATASALFRADWGLQYRIVEVSPAVSNRAMDLAAMYGLRGYDAVHVAAAVELQDTFDTLSMPTITFVSADAAQLSAAQAEHIAVENPAAHP